MTTLQSELVVNFLLGGTIISSVSYIASFISPLIAAIVWSYPFSILPTVYFMKQQSKSNKQVSKFLFATSCAFILLFVTTITTAYFLKHDTSEMGFDSIVKATGIWAVCSVLFYFGVKYFDATHHFV